MEWKRYQRVGIIEMRPYEVGEDISGISVSPTNTPKEGGYIARNPVNHNDQWYVNGEYVHIYMKEVESLRDSRE